MNQPELPPVVTELLKQDPPRGGWLNPDFEPGLVSVIITACNSADLIGETLTSILAQTYGKVEVVAVDDGSADSTPEVLAQWRDRFRAERGWEMRVLRQPNCGQNSARNLGARESRGEYLNFFDSDDLMAADRLAAVVGMLRAGNQDLDLVHGPWVRFYRGRMDFFVAEQSRFDHDGPDLLRGWLAGSSMIIWAALLRRRFADRVGPFDDRLTGGNVGSEHILRLMLQQPRMRYCQAGPIFYRRHAGSVTFNLEPQAYANAVYWLTRFERHLAQDGRLEAYGKELARKFRRYSFDAYRDGVADMGAYFASRAAVHDPDFVPPRKLLRKLAFRLGGLRFALWVQGKTQRLRRWRWRVASALGLTPRLERVTKVKSLPLQPQRHDP